jgi:hypothetical protein
MIMNKLIQEIKKMQKYITLMEGTNWSQLENFLRDNEIEFMSVDWLGSGEYGNAYSLGNGKVFKTTNSESEFEIAGQLWNKNIPGLVQVFDRGWYQEERPKLYYIVMEELDTDSSIEDMFSRVEMILTTQGLDISQTGSFDEDEYDGSEGELDAETIKFMDDLTTIYRSCRNLGIRVPDVNYGNLGYDSTGHLKLFDVQDRAAMINRMW